MTVTACIQTRHGDPESIVRVTPNRNAQRIIWAFTNAGLPDIADRVHQHGTTAWIELRSCARYDRECRRRFQRALAWLPDAEIRHHRGRWGDRLHGATRITLR